MQYNMLSKIYAEKTKHDIGTRKNLLAVVNSPENVCTYVQKRKGGTMFCQG